MDTFTHHICTNRHGGIILTATHSDSGLFAHKSKNATAVVIIYVEDALFMGDDRTLVNKLKSDFMHKWECHIFGDVKEVLHVRITRKSGNSI